DRINPRLQPRRDERLHAGDGQLLVFRIGQVDDLRDEVTGLDLVEVLAGELDRDRVVSQVGVGRRGGRGDLNGRIEHEARILRDLGELQSVNVSLGEVVTSGDGKLSRQIDPIAVAGGRLPADFHAGRIDEEDLA